MSVLICFYLISDQMSSSDVLIDAYIKLFRPPHRSPWDGVHQPRSVLLCRPRRGRSMPRHGIRTPAQENFESSSTRPPSKANLLWWLLAVVCKQVLEHSCSLGIKVSLMEIVSNRRLVSASWVSWIECFQIKRFWAEELLVLTCFTGWSKLTLPLLLLSCVKVGIVGKKHPPDEILFFLTRKNPVCLF